MIQFLLFVLAVLTSFSTSSDDHDKCVGLRYFKQRRIDDAVKYLLRSGTENDYDTSIALAVSFHISLSLYFCSTTSVQQIGIVLDDGKKVEHDRG